ncbi:MAG: hypothetical protein WCO45_18145 [Pseudanabaena sp. ELA607]
MAENSSHISHEHINDYGDSFDGYALQSIHSECQPMTKGIKNGLRFELVSDIAHA